MSNEHSHVCVEPSAIFVSPPLPTQEPAQATSASTQAAYAKDLRLFARWGGTVPCDADTVSRYIFAHRNKVAPSTLYRRAMAIRYGHRQRGLPTPTDEQTLRWTLRQLQLGLVPLKAGNAESSKSPAKAKSVHQAKPITRHHLSRMLDSMHRNALDRRDRAMLLLGFFGALNRTQLTAIDVTDVTFTADAMLVQVNAGVRHIAISVTGGDLCAATAVRKWIEHVGLDTQGGPLFRRFDRASNPTQSRLDAAYVSVVLKERLEAVGIESASFSAHSLRRGRLAEAAKGVL